MSVTSWCYQQQFHLQLTSIDHKISRYHAYRFTLPYLRGVRVAKQPLTQIHGRCHGDNEKQNKNHAHVHSCLKKKITFQRGYEFGFFLH